MIRAAACWLAAGAAYLGLEALAATGVSGYSYSHHLISDLGTPDSPLRWAMNTAFVVQGTLFCAGAAFLARSVRSRNPVLFVSFAAANAVGNVLVALVPSTSPAAWVHVAGAALAIVGGNCAILAGARFVSGRRWYLTTSYVTGVAGLTSAALITLGGAVAERASVYTIIGWQVLSAVVMLSAAALPRYCRPGLRRTQSVPTESPVRD